MPKRVLWLILNTVILSGCQSTTGVKQTGEKISAGYPSLPGFYVSPGPYAQKTCEELYLLEKRQHGITTASVLQLNEKINQTHKAIRQGERVEYCSFYHEGRYRIFCLDMFEDAARNQAEGIAILTAYADKGCPARTH